MYDKEKAHHNDHTRTHTQCTDILMIVQCISLKFSFVIMLQYLYNAHVVRTVHGFAVDLKI